MALEVVLLMVEAALDDVLPTAVALNVCVVGAMVRAPALANPVPISVIV
jgi:hypothetical protein